MPAMKMSPDYLWRMTLQEFSLFGGFRGVQELAEKRGVIAIVIIDKIDRNVPNFRRPGSPFTRITNLYVGNFSPEDRKAVVDAYCAQLASIDYSSPMGS